MKVQNGIDSYLDNFRQRIKSIDRQNYLMVMGVSAVVCALVIVFWGYLYAISVVPWPKNQVPEFPTEAYQTAQTYYKSQSTVVLLDDRAVNTQLREYLKTSKYYDIHGFTSTLAGTYKGKFLVVKPFSKLKLSPDNKKNLLDLKTALETKTKTLKEKMDKATYWDRNPLRRSYRAVQQEFEMVERFYESVSEQELVSGVNFPYNSGTQSFTLVAGHFGRLDVKGKNSWGLELKEARPVLRISWFKKKADPAVLNTQLKKDKDLFDRLYSEARKQYRVKKRTIEQKIRASIEPRRERVRDWFFEKWFAILIMTIVSTLMAVLLAFYYAIIRRKGLPVKATHEIYFATNTTSQLFRVIALLIVIIGFIGLVANIVLAMWGQKAPFGGFRHISLLYGFLSPIGHTLVTIALSWAFVLWSEFICFASNCYHVMFIKAHGSTMNNSKSQNGE